MVFTVVTQKTTKKGWQNEQLWKHFTGSTVVYVNVYCVSYSVSGIKNDGQELPARVLAAGNTHNRSVLTHSSISREIYFKTLCLMGSTPNCTWIHMCQGNALSCTINTIHSTATHLQHHPQMCHMSTVCVALPRARSWAEPSIAKHWLQRHKLLDGRTIFVTQENGFSRIHVYGMI